MKLKYLSLLVCWSFCAQQYKGLWREKLDGISPLSSRFPLGLGPSVVLSSTVDDKGRLVHLWPLPHVHVCTRAHTSDLRARVNCTSWQHTFNPALGRQRQVDLPENTVAEVTFRVSLSVIHSKVF